jgi:hypothetical protein
VPNTRLTPSKIVEHVNIAEAIGEYNRYRPQHADATLTIAADVKRHGPLDHKGLAGVTRLEFVRESIHTGDIDPFDPYSHVHGISMGHGETYGSYAQQLQSQEEARQVTSSEPEWHTQWERDGGCYIYTDVPPGADYLCSYTYSWHVTPDNDADTGMQFIPNGDVDWVLKYVTALVKEILARIRGKFHGITGPDGSVEDVDYSELSEEGRTEKEALIDDLKLRAPPILPVLG